MKAGFIGTGSIGLPLAANILENEQSLVAYDIRPEATAPLEKKQASIAQSPRDVADRCDIVFACMPSISAFEAIVSNDDGVLGGSQMKLFVNLGTMGTEAVAAAETQFTAHGVGMLDAPITGGVQRAWAGDITVIASGPLEVFTEAKPILEAFARDVHHVGEKVGQAQLVKVCNNIMSFTNFVVGLEALVMVGKGGVDPELALKAINSGSGQNSATLSKIPNFVLNRNFNMEAPMHIIEKDAALWRVEAERLDVPHQVASATYETIRSALAMGLRTGDLSEMVKVVERTAGFELPKTRE
ncbi:MAG: NAD(P)-dependent oxidoreductase [Gammaproteobacteria bacterium]|nr:NAD(P)-dependent oxidoreductase [Gammaproteobacteria bacterium]